jgi:hypothetical protein
LCFVFYNLPFLNSTIVLLDLPFLLNLLNFCQDEHS